MSGDKRIEVYPIWVLFFLEAMLERDERVRLGQEESGDSDTSQGLKALAGGSVGVGPSGGHGRGASFSQNNAFITHPECGSSPFTS